MTKVNAKAEAALSMDQVMELVAKLKAENDSLKAARNGAVSLSDKGGINVTLPSGKGSVTMHFYAWHWAKISEMKAEIDTFVKKNADKLTTEAAFRASKAK